MAILEDPEADGQNPIWRDGLKKRIRFAPDDEFPVRISGDAREWQGIQNTQSRAILEIFIARHTRSVFTLYAKARLKELQEPISAENTTQSGGGGINPGFAGASNPDDVGVLNNPTPLYHLGYRCQARHLQAAQ